MTTKNILITGATGLIGSALKNTLTKNGYTVFILSTSISDEKSNIYKWDPVLKVYEMLPNEPFYAVINLAGASIADTKWDEDGMELIKKSRFDSTYFLKNIIDCLPESPQHIISASATGYYGTVNDEIKTENSPNGSDFAAEVCRDWEKAAKTLEYPQSKLSIIRIGIVLSEKGGFYQKIKQLAKYKIASPLGNGKQPVCWIHINDLINIFTNILDNQLQPGIYNAVASCNSNKEVIKFIAKQNGQPFLWPAVPSFLLNILFGKKADIFTSGTVVSNSKLINENFKFEFNRLDTVRFDNH